MGKGKVVMVINVASMCGNTGAAYGVLKYFHETYAEHGLDIILTPCGQFGFNGGQEPLDGPDLKEQILKRVAGLVDCKDGICTTSDRQAFEKLRRQKSKESRLFITEKMDVETRFWSWGDNTGELWRYLKSCLPGKKVLWNFGTTFLINHLGRVSFRHDLSNPKNLPAVKETWKETIDTEIKNLLPSNPEPPTNSFSDAEQQRIIERLGGTHKMSPKKPSQLEGHSS